MAEIAGRLERGADERAPAPVETLGEAAGRPQTNCTRKGSSHDLVRDAGTVLLCVLGPILQPAMWAR
jgi:hypothetical protein